MPLGDPTQKRQAWDYQPGVDSDQSFAVFSYWLKLPPPRNLSLAARACGVSPGTVSAWAKDDLWRQRAAEHDRVLNGAWHEEIEKAYRADGAAAAVEWLEPITTAKGFIRDQLEKLQIEGADRQGVRIKPNELARLFQVIFQAERLLRGQSTEIRAEEIDTSKWTDEELDLYDKLVRKAKKDP